MLHFDRSGRRWVSLRSSLSSLLGDVAPVPITTTFDPDRHRRTHVVTGRVDPDEIVRELETVFSDPRYRRGDCALWDLRHVTAIPSSAEVHRVATVTERLRASGGASCVALVVGDDALFGMARMFEALVVWRSGRCKVFRSVEDGEAWLATCRAADETPAGAE